MKQLINFTEIFPGVWRGAAGQADSSLLRFYAPAPLGETLSALPKADFPFKENPFFERVNNKCALGLPLDSAEHLYGLGLGFKSLSVRGKVRHQRTDHYGGEDNGRTHVPAPVYVSDKGYAVLIDTAEYISFYMGNALRTEDKKAHYERNRSRDADWSAEQNGHYVEACFTGAGADIYIFADQDMLGAVSRCNLFLGGGCLPPKWGLGMWHRCNMNYGEEEIRAIAADFAARGFDLDVIGLEPGWQTACYPCSYVWDKARFPDPAAFVGGMLDKGIRVNLWENMYISSKSDIYDEILPYCGSHTVWNGIVPDLTTAEARTLLSDQHARAHVDIGVSGYKIDECDGFDEWLWPDHASFPSGVPAGQMRQLLGALAQKLIDDLFRKHNRRTYGLVRASNIGAASFPFCIYNDCYAFEQFLTGVATAGFCGALWTPEVRDAASADEWALRFQLAAFSPILMLNAWSNDAAPWMFEAVQDTIRDIITLRKRMLPYFYNAFAAYRAKGIPPFRALCMDFSSMKATIIEGRLDSTGNPYNLDIIEDIVDQYLIGNSLMAAPFKPNQTGGRDVVLPPVKWYDFYTRAYVGCGQTIHVPYTVERMPLFVREGGLIPLIDESDLHKDDDIGLTVYCYGERGQTTLYDDDGETFDFENGLCAEIGLSFARTNGTLSAQSKITSRGYQTKYTRIKFE